MAPQYARRGLATTKAKAKRAPRKTVKKAAEKKLDAPAEDPRLPVLSLTALRDLAVLCGRNSSGTRAVLRADLEEAMDETPPTMTEAKKSPQRILSIDMGVRNLAYCLLEMPSSPKGGHSVPKLVAWERLSLIGGPEKDESEESAAKLPASTFSPPSMATVAARLIRDRLLPLSPTHILIERQRFRSGGAAAVLEWTVRVNSLEAMLHGIFAYRQLEETASNTVQTVQAVSPQRASRFLLQGGMGAGHAKELLPPRTGKTKEKNIKDAKEAFVAGLLRTPKSSKLVYDESTRGMVDAFLIRWEAKQSRGRVKSKDETTKTKSDTKPKSEVKPTVEALITLSKIDDLADCVAQGLIWIEWEGNKAILRAKGAEDLLATKQLTG
ncbi:hypothetical protein Sste5346_003275 [Sporothrix stenoceras]|uniref:Mitochondrial resolvase Ydc2 catalytic domain-containing protein n=1 Tax=Sporothrix stenoceras TaxID=5173 RepID=A0ABR3ZH61_9PEZI